VQYIATDGFSMPIQPYGLTTYPDGGVRTSVADLSRLFAALLNEGEYEGVRILERPVAREMLRFHFTEASKPDNVDLKEKNSGIFWQTKFNVTRMGHGGSDPGISTEMLANLSRDVGVVLFSNTSLSGEEAKAYVAILQALWARAEAVKSEGAGAPTR
jgi:CubicO group peptidase (beta-lactamase class C family)